MKKIFLFLLLILSMTALHAQENDKLSEKSDNGKASVNDSIRQRNDSLMWEKLLSGVTIKAQRQLIKTEIDRIGYDVQADEDSKTENVLEMLKKVPMVSIDAQENILVKGNSNFKIYKNGHPDPSLTKNAKEILRAMPASMVKRIEVITDPGAKEDAEGVNAILRGQQIGGRDRKRDRLLLHAQPPQPQRLPDHSGGESHHLSRLRLRWDVETGNRKPQYSAPHFQRQRKHTPR